MKEEVEIHLFFALNGWEGDVGLGVLSRARWGKRKERAREDD